MMLNPPGMVLLVLLLSGLVAYTIVLQTQLAELRARHARLTNPRPAARRVIDTVPLVERPTRRLPISAHPGPTDTSASLSSRLAFRLTGPAGPVS